MLLEITGVLPQQLLISLMHALSDPSSCSPTCAASPPACHVPAGAHLQFWTHSHWVTVGFPGGFTVVPRIALHSFDIAPSPPSSVLHPAPFPTAKALVSGSALRSLKERKKKKGVFLLFFIFFSVLKWKWFLEALSEPQALSQPQG